MERCGPDGKTLRTGNPAYRPDLIDEMKGIAEGAGVPFDVILTLNCRSEVMFAKSEAPADECSVIGVPQESHWET